MHHKSSRKIPVSLFDISQDIIKSVPFELIKEWLSSDHSLAAARKILEPTIVEGITVCSDSSGLSKISQEKSLIEVLEIIDKPKQIVYALGTKIGGREVGIWAADNTQMFYPKNLDTTEIISTQLKIQEYIASLANIKIGMGAHYGKFYDIGGGLYGIDAEFIESISEDQTEGGEIVISEAIKNKLGEGFKLELRNDLENNYQKIYRVLDGPKNTIDFDYSKFYPIPYSESFYNDLLKFSQNKSRSALDELNKKYLEEKVVVLVERAKESDLIAEIQLLDDIALYAAMEKSSTDLLSKFDGEEIKTVSNLGIYTFNDVNKAIEFSKHFRKILTEENIPCKVGITSGEVIIFELNNKTKDIAGSPVNISSKLAQDKGKFGKIYIHAPATNSICPPGFIEQSVIASHVEIKYFEN